MAVSLCGRQSCKRLCQRSQHCGQGQERAAWLLCLQRERQELRQAERRREQHWQIELNIERAAGPFAAFQERLRAERFKEVRNDSNR